MITVLKKMLKGHCIRGWARMFSCVALGRGRGVGRGRAGAQPWRHLDLAAQERQWMRVSVCSEWKQQAPHWLPTVTCLGSGGMRVWGGAPHDELLTSRRPASSPPPFSRCVFRRQDGADRVNDDPQTRKRLKALQHKRRHDAWTPS